MMLEHITAALLAALLLGLVTNQVTRIIQDGAIFSLYRTRMLLWYGGRRREGIALRHRLIEGFGCHLCFGQWIASLVTWTTVAVGLAVGSSALPWQEWVLLATVGPFAVGGVDQLIEMFRREDA